MNFVIKSTRGPDWTYLVEPSAHRGSAAGHGRIWTTEEHRALAWDTEDEARAALAREFEDYEKSSLKLSVVAKPTAKPVPAANREEWLGRGLVALSPFFHDVHDLPPVDTIRVSCGWPVGTNKAIGQIFGSVHSADGSLAIFISPTIDDRVKVLATLLHELVHAAVGIKEQHGPAFRKVALRLGFVGKMTQTDPGDELRSRLVDVADQLGPYPHSKMARLVPGEDIKKKKTYMLKVACPDCGCIVRMTQKWAEVGLPTCCCGASMELVEK